MSVVALKKHHPLLLTLCLNITETAKTGCAAAWYGLQSRKQKSTGDTADTVGKSNIPTQQTQGLQTKLLEQIIQLRCQ